MNWEVYSRIPSRCEETNHERFRDGIRKLELIISPNTPPPITISQQKVKAFKEWIERLVIYTFGNSRFIFHSMVFNLLKNS